MLNFLDLYNELKDQRYFSVIIHSKPNTGLSDFAKNAASLINAKYINLLEMFLNNKELAIDIAGYSDQKLSAFLRSEAEDTTALVVDKIDFLLDTWNPQEMKSFISIFNKHWDTWKFGSTRPALIVFIETNSFISDLEIKFDNGKSKIYTLSQFSAL